MTALNIAYQEKENGRSGAFYIAATVITVAAVIVAVLALIGRRRRWARLGNFVPEASPVMLMLAKVAEYIAAHGCGGGDRRHALPLRAVARGCSLAWITPGSLFAAVAVAAAYLAFSFYVTRITDYNVTYGSLGTIVLLLTWNYLSAYALIFGAELNSEIEHQTAVDSTTGKPLPLGKGAPGRPTMSRRTIRPDRKDAPSMAEATPDAPTAVERLGGGKQLALAGEADQRRLQLLERANLDLADALAADAVDLAQLLERLGSSARRRSVRMCFSRSLSASIALTSRSWRTRLSSSSAISSS